MIALSVRTFEGLPGKLVLEHQFFGATKDECLKLYNAHLKMDSFLNAAAKVGDWRGVRLENRSHWVVI